VIRDSYLKEVLALLTPNRKEVLASCSIQPQAARKKAQEVASLRTQKEVLAHALFLGCPATEDQREFWWTRKCEDAFCQLKTLLTTAPILAFPTTNGLFILDTDASNTGLGVVLSQV